MKPFNLTLADLNGGQTNATLTTHFAELLEAVQKHGRAGSLKITVKVAPAGKGGDVDKVLVACDSQITLPKPEMPTDFFWMTEDAELSRQHPRQQSLELRDVSAPTNAPLTPAAALAVAVASNPSTFTPVTTSTQVQAVANGMPTTFTPPDDDGVIQPLP